MPGAWTTPTFDATIFTGNGTMAWTLAAGDVTTLKYHMVDAHTMRVTFSLVTTTVVAPLSTNLRIQIPEGKVPTKTMRTLAHIRDNGTYATGYCQVTAGVGRIIIVKLSGNWTAATNATEVHGQILFEVD